MSLTVRELIDIPTLRTRVLAGATGLDRIVQWAHSCELSEPWQWMGAGDLVMTTGQGFPSSPSNQENYLEKLSEAGLSGVVLAEGMTAPPLTAEAIRAADSLAMPVLETAFEVPFVMLSRAVGDSAQRETQARLARILRLYDTFRRATAESADEDTTMRAVSESAAVSLQVVDTEEATVVMSSGGRMDDETLAHLLDQVRKRIGPLPSVVRISVGECRYLVQPLRGDRWVLVTSLDDKVIDLTVLQHTATIALILLERRRTTAEARMHAGSRLLNQLIRGELDTQLAVGYLKDNQIIGSPWLVAMLAPGADVDLFRIHQRLLDAEINHLLDRLGDRIVVLMAAAANTEALTGIAAAGGLAIGLSETVRSLIRLPEAVRESRWALESAQTGAVVLHGADISSFLPRTVSEGEAVVARVLGAVLAYDAEHENNLLTSMQAFFAAERSWQAAAKQLCVHKQTLVYRMRRVQELTGRRFDRLEDLAELHFALRTYTLLADGR